MRYEAGHKAETRRRVLTEAARDIRAKGPQGIALAGIMARAGLTHGGFYAHFPSRDALVAAAIETMFDDARARFDFSVAAASPRTTLRAYIDFYLSASHRDERERGCPLAALSGDIARFEPAARERFGAGIAALTVRLETLLHKNGIADPPTTAASLLAELVGALSLSRAIADPAQSDALLQRCRRGLYLRFDLGSDQ